MASPWHLPIRCGRRGSAGCLLPRVLLVSLHAALADRDYAAALNTLHAYFDHVQVRALAH